LYFFAVAICIAGFADLCNILQSHTGLF
jgi:hypothetical protein